MNKISVSESAERSDTYEHKRKGREVEEMSEIERDRFQRFVETENAGLHFERMLDVQEGRDMVAIGHKFGILCVVHTKNAKEFRRLIGRFALDFGKEAPLRESKSHSVNGIQ